MQSSINPLKPALTYGKSFFYTDDHPKDVTCRRVCHDHSGIAHQEKASGWKVRFVDRRLDNELRLTKPAVKSAVKSAQK
jgi:hypothetical protein